MKTKKICKNCTCQGIEWSYDSDITPDGKRRNKLHFDCTEKTDNETCRHFEQKDGEAK